MLVEHFKTLRRDPRFRTTYLPVFMETNTDWTATKRVERLITGPASTIPHKDRIWFVPSDASGKNRPGVRTTDEEKRIGADELETHLMDRSFRYAANFFTNTEKSPALMKKKAEAQMQSYRHEMKVTDPIFSKIKHKWTGKSPGRPDDVCWIIQMGLLHSSALRKNKEFIGIANREGWLLA